MGMACAACGYEHNPAATPARVTRTCTLDLSAEPLTTGDERVVYLPVTLVDSPAPTEPFVRIYGTFLIEKQMRIGTEKREVRLYACPRCGTVRLDPWSC